MDKGIIEVIITASIVVIFWLLSQHLRPLKMLLRKNIFFKLSLFLVTAYTSGIIGMYLLERDINPQFSSFYQSFWVVTFYILGGLRSTLPKTNGGKFISILLLLVGIGAVGTIIGKMVEIILIKEVIMSSNIKEHYIICNWSKKGEKIIKEIHSPLASPDVPIIVLAKKHPANEETLRNDFSDEFSNVEFRAGDPTQYDALRHARVETAKGVLILADKNSSDADAKSVMIALTINGLCKNLTRKPHIVAESLEHDRIDHLKEAGVDEVICANDYGIGLLAQSLLYSKLSDIYDQLLTYSEDTNEFYEIEYKELKKMGNGKVFIEGKAFNEIVLLFDKNRDNKNPLMLVGMKKRNNIYLNPRGGKTTGKQKNEATVFRKGDSLIIMAYERPKLGELKQLIEGI